MKNKAHDEVTAILREAARGGVEALENVAAELKSQIATEQPRRRAVGLQSDVDAVVEDLTRLASALKAMPDVNEESEDLPSHWMRYDDGTWVPVYPDGSTGHQFTWAQMLAARGEDVGAAIESLISAGLIAEVQEVGIDVFDHGRG
ncbi:hypothetical protein [Nocardia nepalensis]|uniref:hypothetical protein n=1 Tax=Nocardia nepalensis TaxID=3375448 RepID=UPI003B6826E1